MSETSLSDSHKSKLVVYLLDKIDQESIIALQRNQLSANAGASALERLGNDVVVAEIMSQLSEKYKSSGPIGSP